ncbi:carboxy terminal motor kinesin [Salpingoeca rosetta]|uniref:Carboxy terminal motor kinesin n=1 Tax=Salpingoeca rosetta (strain ATCC 50818 / BSB-021) TaxID=946362 RepID=F2TVU7_SALR5|nr:carboxy terminal motor kinesin [Salpingoeca rosetta]EGD72193.1 carboxy terminal motor kinesin [Salpingoeca rosetta]|eukprot:XP_004998764.1 carboxy terminal motor kinesin [Salpingoeca rosetta]
MATECEKEEENIQVILRVRPLVGSGVNDNDTIKCLNYVDEKAVKLESNKNIFTFDEVLTEESTQDKVFETVAKRVIESCLEGYNGTIFAYGQTGSGKTFTMMGRKDDNDDIVQEERGIIPRAFEFLFSQIQRECQKKGNVSFSCSCSFTEIYNERIYDLLDATCTGKNLREDVRNGVHIEDVTEHIVESPREAMEVLNAGNGNRRTAETSMNRESSRSHAIFTMTIKSIESTGDGLRNVKMARLNLIDLAGSERQRDTQADGTRLREAGQINKSLSTLGNVITALVSIANGKQRHVPYRDSKLTFLLRDSLGGNTKTYLLAAVNPSRKAFGETLSTLKFAQRAKLIKNKTARNEDFVGNVRELQAEVKRLRDLLAQPNMQALPALPPGVQTDGDDDGDLRRIVCTMIDLHKRSESEKEDLAERLQESQELLSAYQRSLQALKMRYKFREAEVSQLKRGAGASVDEDEQLAALRKEIKALEQEIKVNVDAARLLTKNKALQAELRSLRSQYPVDDDNAVLAQTRTRMLELEEIVQRLLVNNKDSASLGQLISSANASPAPGISPRMRDGKHLARQTKVESELKQQVSDLQQELKETRDQLTQVEENAQRKVMELASSKRAAEKTTAELERALEAERMKAAAREAQARDEQLQELSKAFADSEQINDLASLRSKMEALVHEVKSSQAVQEELTQQISSLESASRQLRQDKEQLTSQLSMEQTAHAETSEELKSTIATLEQRLDGLLSEMQDKATEFQTSLQEQQAAAAALTTEKEAMQKELAQSQRKVAELDKENTDQAGQLVSIRHDLEAALTSNQDLMDERDTLDGELQFVQEELDRITQELSDEKAKTSSLTHEQEALQATIAKLEDSVAKYEQQLNDDSDQKSEMLELSQKNQELVEQIEASVAAQIEAQDTLESTREELNEAKDRFARKEARMAEEKAAIVAELRTTTDQLKELKSSNESLTAELKECKEEVDRLTAELGFATDKQAEFQRLLKHTESVIAKNEDEYKDQMAEVVETTTLVKDELRASKARVQELETQLQSARDVLAAKEDDAAQRIAQLEQSLDELKAANTDLRQQLEAPRENATALEQEVQSLQQQLAASKTQEKKYLEMLDAAEASRVEKNSELSQLRADLDAAKRTASESASMVEELEETRAENRRLEASVRAAQRTTEDHTRAVKELEEVKSQLTMKESHRRRLEDEVKEQASELAESLVCAQELNKDLLGMKESLDRARKENLTLRKENSQLKKAVKALEEERDGLVGHQNPRQKLKHMAKIRAENNELRMRLNELSKEVAMLKRQQAGEQENLAVNVC